MKIRTIITMLIAMIVASSAMAGVVWNVSSGDWATGSNWDTGNLPGGGDYGAIDNGGTCTISSPVSSYGIWVGSVAGSSGGTLNIAGDYTGAGGSFGIGSRASAGSVYQTAGDVDTSGTWYIGYQPGVGDSVNGLWSISGGSMAVGNAESGANSTIQLAGSGASDISVIGYYYHRGTIDAQIDSGGITSMDITGTVQFRTNSKLDVEALAGAEAGTYTVMTYDSVDGYWDGSRISFADGVDTDIWSFDVGTKALTVTMVPEPATISMLSIGAGLVMVLRRRLIA